MVDLLGLVDLLLLPALLVSIAIPTQVRVRLGSRVGREVGHELSQRESNSFEIRVHSRVIIINLPVIIITLNNSQ